MPKEKLKDINQVDAYFNTHSLYLNLDSNQGTIELDAPIDMQNLTIKMTKVTFNGSIGGSYTNMFVKLSGLLASNHCNNNIRIPAIPIFHIKSNPDGTISHPNLTFTMNKKWPKKFKYYIVDETDTLITANDLERVSLWCEYDIGTII